MRILLALLSGCLAFSICNPLEGQARFRKKARVLTAAWASPEFEAQRQTPDGLAHMSYHIYPGNFHQGLVNDSSLEKISLQEIMETLAPEMAEQNFTPAATFEEGEMVIIVHWGVTAVQEDWADLFPEANDGDTEYDEDGNETGYVDSELSHIATMDRPSVASNAQLTGINRALEKKGLLPSDREAIRSLLEDERYFIVLMAYDWPLLRTEKQHKLLWSCRFSLPAQSTNFVDAVPSLGRAAAPFMGTNLDGLDKTKTQLGWGKGTVGELEVVSEVSEEELENIQSE
ncbi:hypothetical protein [Pelagicoccus mobilis]|uniref:Uncharacterized protein n=1 Tax=Pelagicoccus mobilis TaxID=415221 RepID=A0A934RTA0_9BACT|nr:hypothetical protein [Pelagicoccus mobilis]MBK1876467.1 hypothetical protein [Pelagicoccus mobilis]